MKFPWEMHREVPLGTPAGCPVQSLMVLSSRGVRGLSLPGFPGPQGLGGSWSSNRNRAQISSHCKVIAAILDSSAWF